MPVKVLEQSDSNTLRIAVEPFTDSQTGGSAITGYQIELDDGMAGPYTVVLGENAQDPNYLSLETEVTIEGLT